jgi:Reverse transcriptase (RNA-dependent DNA polymerase)
MNRELKDLNSQNTWTLMELPEGKHCLKGKWIYKTKLDQNGRIIKHKARWVAKGYLQQYGIKYLKTFANTAQPAVFRALFAIAAYFNWEIHHWDVKSAFPNAPINEEIYIQQPIGFKQEKSLVCKLNKALYGLKQSAHQWQLYLQDMLLKIGCKSLNNDPSIYIYREKTVIITHIDDILIFSQDMENINIIRKKLASKLELSNLEEAKYFLGIEIIQNRQNKRLVLL